MLGPDAVISSLSGLASFTPPASNTQSPAGFMAVCCGGIQTCFKLSLSNLGFLYPKSKRYIVYI